jgi:hypothetical protein
MEWISVSKSLPQVNFEQLLFLSSGGISTGYLSKRRPVIEWFIHNEEERFFEVTHWMPLPADAKTE